MKRLLATAAFAAALALLLVITARGAVAQNVKLASESQQGVVEGIVVPDSIYDRQAFSFTAPQAIAGEVVSVQTVDGVVVQSASTDKYGRVFLAAGLPAGAYLISGSSHQPVGKIEIIQHVGDALEPPQPIQLQNPPQALKLSDPWSLNGHGFSPDPSKMQVSLTGSGKSEAPMILAATEDQLKLAPLQQLKPGLAQLTVTNNSTKQSAELTPLLLLYDMQGHLERRKLTSGNDQTQLVVRTEPANLPVQVHATVLSGPVDFGHGLKEVGVVANQGQAVFPVYAERGAGPFQLAWSVANPALAVTDGPSNPQQWVEEKAKDCQKGADASTDNSSVAKDLKNEAKLDQETAKDKKNWGNGGQPADKNKFGKFLNDEIARLKKILQHDGEGNAKDSIKKAISDAIEAGKSAGLDF